MTNLLLIDCHDLGQHLGCYGKSTVSSNNIDQLAKDGVRFENSFCTAPQCSPSRASLYTGRYPHNNGMLGLAHDPFSWRLHDDEVYLAKYLQDAGYETAHIGIQHVTDSHEESVKSLGFNQVLSGYLAPEIAKSAVEFLQGAHERPFFLNIGFFEPHRDAEGGFRVAPPDDTKGIALPSYIPDTPEAREEFSELQGMIKQMDIAVGAIITTLRQQDLLQDTWIIFTTDHGLAMPRAKCTMYDQGIETALVMFAPPLQIEGGHTFNQLISNVDLVPTILEGLQLPIPQTLQGKSHYKVLKGEEKDTVRDAIFAEKTFHTDYEPQRMIRTKHHKLIWNAEVDIINVPADIMHSPIYPQMIDALTVERTPFELYDLQNDPNELQNCAGNPDYASIENDLRHRLLSWMQQTDDPLLDGPVSSPFYARALRQLKADVTL